MSTRERKATRSNTDSPTISNSSSRSDTASPVTTGTRNKNRTETTPVRNSLRSTRAGSVAQSQSGSPPETEPEPQASTEEVSVENPRLRPTRHTTNAAAGAEEKATPTRGIRKVVVAAQVKRNSLPTAVGRAAKMTTRRNSSGRMEAILKACKEDESGQLVTKSKRGRPIANNTSANSAERRPLLRRKRGLSADEPEKVGEEMEEDAGDEAAQEEELEGESVTGVRVKAQKVLKLDETALSDSELSKSGGGRRSVDSVVSKCSETTEQLETVKQEPMEEEEEEKNSPEKVETVVGTEDKKDMGESQEGKKADVAVEEEEKTDKSGDQGVVEVKQKDTDPVKSSSEVRVVNGTSTEEKKEGGTEKETELESETKKVETTSLNGELTIKVESVEVKESESAEKLVSGEEEKEVSAASPTIARETLSPVSVQQICGQPAFLENNPGIEKDPTVAAEMVQVQEKIAKRVEVKGDDGKENQNVNVPESETTKESQVAEEGEEKAAEKESEKLLVPEIKKEPESPECSAKKVNHLKVLGLLTWEAADKAKHEKARRREILKAFPTPPSLNLQAVAAGGDSDGGGSNSGRTGRNGSGSSSNKEGGNDGTVQSTGTLKTVIKLNRKKGDGANNAKAGNGGTGGAARQSLKMTFQKGRAKGTSAQNGTGTGGGGKDSRQSASEGEEYYTISKETNSSLGTQAQTATGEAGNQQGHEHPGRKTTNRSQPLADCGGSTHSGEGGEAGKEENLVIPEKASSFSIHPDRLCQDQCFYCGGKFGLFDTPLHIAQIKTQERQKKILDNEEKLSADSCLCDACYRHVDRRANCPSYKKRLSAPASLAQQRMAEEAMEVDEQASEAGAKGGGGGADGAAKRNRGLSCSLCRAKMAKNRSFALNQNVKRLEDTIRSQGIPVQWGIVPVVCKLCKFYTEHLTKEQRGETTENNTFAENYRRRLVSFYKTEDAHRKKQRQETGGEGQRHQQQQQSQHGEMGRRGSQTGPVGLDSETSRALSRNPAISIRELFPGEDEMGLSVHLPFGQAGLRTPEGWTRSYSLLQYDDATRQLWDELQRPYGNQSSFIRHLVLLEKYFRNGDLVLSKNASSSAVTYSDSVQTRLRAFDSVSTENRNLLKQLSNAPITITQMSAPKPPPPVTSVAVVAPTQTQSSPPPLVPSVGVSVSSATTNGAPSKVVVEPGTSLLKKSVSSRPPDLISISASVTATPLPIAGANTTVTAVIGGAGCAEKATTVTKSLVASTNNSSTGSTTTTTSTTVATPSTATGSGPASPTKRVVGSSPTKARESVIVTLPDSLSPEDRLLVNGKSWRPTLMPVEKIELNPDGTRSMFQTADGRLLPSRVQVMSGGKPYHISIYDYNRMCILRREKLIQKAMNSQKNQSQGSIAELAANSSIVAMPIVGATSSPPKFASAGQSSQQQPQVTPKTVIAPSVQIPNNVLEQNSLIPVTTNASLTITPANEMGGGDKGQRRSSRSNSGKSGTISFGNLGSEITATVTTANGGGGAAPADKLATHNWMWNPGDLSKESMATFVGSPVDNSAAAAVAATASLLSRVPKSLTVIPQQKLM